MAQIVDKILLFFIGMVLISRSDTFIEPVAAMLIGIIAAALGIAVKNWRIRAVYMLFFMAVCFFLPEIIFFFPLICYDCAMERHLWAVGVAMPVLGLHYTMAGAMELFVLGVWIAGLLFAAVLGRRTGCMETQNREMIRLRDTGAELNLVLREKNKNLMEKQDYEIYLATLRERNRIAREIHDNVGHMLSRSILQVGALATVYKDEPLHEQLCSVNETLNQAMNSIRESVHDLHDEAVDLQQAVLDATRELKGRCEVKIDYDMSAEIPRGVKYCFITTVKEAVSNIVKHSDADQMTVILREHPGFYQMTVEDNGTCGGKQKQSAQGDKADVPAESSAGIGLGNMRERVEALKGTLHIQSENGFRIFMSVPKEQR